MVQAGRRRRVRRPAPAGQALQCRPEGYFLDRDHRWHADVIVRLVLLFPYIPDNVTTMQLWTVVHAVIAMLFIAAMLAHIYIGTIGMEGAFEAMKLRRGRSQLGQRASTRFGLKKSRRGARPHRAVRRARCRQNSSDGYSVPGETR